MQPDVEAYMPNNNGTGHGIFTYQTTDAILRFIMGNTTTHPMVKPPVQAVLDKLPDFQVFEIDRGLCEFAFDQDTFDPDAPVSEECIPPCDRLFAALYDGFGFMIERHRSDNPDLDNECFVSVVSPDFWSKWYHENKPPVIDTSPISLIGTYRPNEPFKLLQSREGPMFNLVFNTTNERPVILDASKLDDYDGNRNKYGHMQKTMMLNFTNLIRLINSPRLTKKGLIPRQQRRSAAKGMGKAVDSWHRVQWDIDKPVSAREPYDKGFHKMPLHFNRGHWKRAEKHHPKSRQRPNAYKPEHRTGWWTWIDGYWAGHPAFGFKKQYWTPTKKVS